MFIIRKIYYFLLDTLQTILLAASFFVVVYIFFFRPFQVNGQSMFPNFYDKEYVLTNLISLRFQELKRGDVVVFVSPTDSEKDYIKRVLGLSGDTVFIKDGDVYVNDKKLDESAYLKNELKTYGGSFLKEGEAVVVPNDQYFVLGDNRPYSSDSREWGFVKKNEIIGLSFWVYWPTDRMRLVENPFN